MFAALLITFGRFGDRFGRRKLLLMSAVVFLLAGILVAHSTNGPQLIGARAIQVIGGAMMLPMSLALVKRPSRVAIGRSLSGCGECNRCNPCI